MMIITDDIQIAVKALERGSLIVIPTDTVYGVASLPNSAGVEKIYCAKERDRDNPIPLLAANADILPGYGALMSAGERLLADRFWPGPLTLVLETVRDGESAVKEGFRVPDHDLAREVIGLCGGILRVTSANLSGMPPALTAADAAEALGDSVEVILDAGPSVSSLPSTVVAVQKDGLKILREGALPASLLEKVLYEK